MRRVYHPAQSFGCWLCAGARAAGVWVVLLGMDGPPASPARMVARGLVRFVWMLSGGAVGTLLQAIAEAAGRCLARRICPW